MKSMTGYGYHELNDGVYQIAVELKSYNNKFADYNVMLPPVLAGLDQRVRDLLASRIQRGRVDAMVRFKLLESGSAWSVDESALAQAIACVQMVKDRIGDKSSLQATQLLAMEGVLRVDSERDMVAIETVLMPVFMKALEQLEVHRIREGLATKADLQRQLGVIESARLHILSKAEHLEQLFHDNLRKRFAEVLGDSVDESRILQELAAMLVRYSIHEELERLGVHCKALAELMEKGDGVAKRIDFLAQEINREINTIGSKSVDSGVSTLVVDCKEAIDRIREQVRNIE